MIKLPSGSDERRHLALLGALNSSIACFWMKQVFQRKTQAGGGGGATEAPFTHQYEHDGTKLKAFPLPGDLDPSTATLLNELASQLEWTTPQAIAGAGTPTAVRLAEAKGHTHDIRAQMVAAQERLDWEIYRRYGLVEDDLTTGEMGEPPLQLGERAFEIVLARRMVAGEEESSWFVRHGSTPITDLPASWSEPYKRLVERRISLIEADRNIGLIERPEYKRRWAAKPWEEQVEVALRGWLLDRLELPRYWPEPAALTSTARLAAEARTDSDFVQVAQLYAGRDDADIAALVAELVKAEAVPYLAALRYTDSGMRKYAQWLETWELQRREDAGEDIRTIPVPPKYVKADFQGVAWDHRGKLDVPKERFVSYPGAERETDPSLVVGWAGWDHLVRARALATWYLQARRDGRDHEHLTPLLAGLAELVPWLRQWYDDPDPDPALDRPGSQIAALLDAELRALHLLADDTARRPHRDSRAGPQVGLRDQPGDGDRRAGGHGARLRGDRPARPLLRPGAVAGGDLGGGQPVEGDLPPRQLRRREDGDDVSAGPAARGRPGRPLHPRAGTGRSQVRRPHRRQAVPARPLPLRGKELDGAGGPRRLRRPHPQAPSRGAAARRVRRRRDPRRRPRQAGGPRRRRVLPSAVRRRGVR